MKPEKATPAAKCPLCKGEKCIEHPVYRDGDRLAVIVKLCPRCCGSVAADPGDNGLPTVAS